MLLLWSLVLGVFVGFIRGGTIAGLDQLEIRHLWLVPLALVIQAQILFYPMLFQGNLFLPWAPEIFHFFSYLVLAVFVGLNWKLWQIPFMGTGMTLNVIVIAANGGYMPSSVASLIRSGDFKTAYYLTHQKTYGNVIMMSDSTVLDFLGDWLYLPNWFPFSTAFSLGDVIIAIGLVFFFGLGMVDEVTE